VEIGRESIHPENLDESPDEKLSDLKAAAAYLTDQPFVSAVGMAGVCTSAGA
jgi:dienelactone hydrolase